MGSINANIHETTATTTKNQIKSVESVKQLHLIWMDHFCVIFISDIHSADFAWETGGGAWQCVSTTFYYRIHWLYADINTLIKLIFGTFLCWRRRFTKEYGQAYYSVIRSTNRSIVLWTFIQWINHLVLLQNYWFKIIINRLMCMCVCV